MRKNILLIDESLTIHKIVELTIEKEAYELFNAYNAEEGVALASSENISCILIDVLIINEEANYLDRLQKASPNAEIIVLVNTFKQFQDVSGVFPLIVHHIVKPFNAPALNMVLRLAALRAEEKRSAEVEGAAESGVSEGEKPLAAEESKTLALIDSSLATESSENVSLEASETSSSEEKSSEEKSSESTTLESSEIKSRDDGDNSEEENSGEHDEPPITEFVITDVFAAGKKTENVTRNDLIVEGIEQDVELEILQKFIEPAETDEGAFPKDGYSYQDISIPADKSSAPDVSTVIDIMDKVIATENIDADIGKLELDLDNNDVSQALQGYGDIDAAEVSPPAKDENFNDLQELDSEDSKFEGVEVELGKTNEELFSSETDERKEILGLFPSAEKSEKQGFKKIAESIIPDKTAVSRLYFELPKDEFVALFKRYLDNTTIDFLLHDTIKSVLEKMLPELLEKTIRKELERIIKGS
ncbi:MAG: hypothetical protein LBP51_00880 [Deferribacteraceae bacterium]|jgi:DNA-binding response OmpR family regulator|nr:hypothetical protein [Deferribacteraceae bacterium]